MELPMSSFSCICNAFEIQWVSALAVLTLLYSLVPTSVTSCIPRAVLQVTTMRTLFYFAHVVPYRFYSCCFRR
uniref:Uncharacterized protein n=1 Tax=Oryza brachyantha TaxID=4533 RepID=J3N7S1_ORYBR